MMYLIVLTLSRQLKSGVILLRKLAPRIIAHIDIPRLQCVFKMLQKLDNSIPFFVKSFEPGLNYLS